MKLVSKVIPGFRFKTKTKAFSGIQMVCLDDFDETVAAQKAYLGERNLLESDYRHYPYFAQVWPAAEVLIEVLKKCESSWNNIKVMELGCGLALPSLWLAKQGATVLVTDSHLDVPMFLRENLILNQVNDRIDFVDFDWESPTYDPRFEKLDYIIASEILYDEEQALALACSLKSLVSNQTRVLIIDPGRPYLEIFIDRLNQELGIQIDAKAYQCSQGRNYFLIDFRV